MTYNTTADATQWTVYTANDCDVIATTWTRRSGPTDVRVVATEDSPHEAFLAAQAAQRDYDLLRSALAG